MSKMNLKNENCNEHSKIHYLILKKDIFVKINMHNAHVQYQSTYGVQILNLYTHRFENGGLTTAVLEHVLNIEKYNTKMTILTVLEFIIRRQQ